MKLKVFESKAHVLAWIQMEFVATLQDDLRNEDVARERKLLRDKIHDVVAVLEEVQREED